MTEQPNEIEREIAILQRQICILRARLAWYHHMLLVSTALGILGWVLWSGVT